MWEGEAAFFSPPHPGHTVSQGSGNGGAGPAPPAPQARTRRVRKFREGLEEAMAVSSCQEVLQRLLALRLLKTYLKSKYCTRQNSICTLSSFPGFQAVLGFTSFRGSFSTGATVMGWGGEQGKEGERD